ncbi:DUF2807 domain-containing protein [Niastella caeni]|uniref:DUF2807 domain-containing protein n=1 Tax=Niastella caeni TaxID=2569763 RepID=A0A4S8HB90_9BACT|nr:head GIN domain-containing protein [Niastella caeni]THU32017.1 DUF2807 domain-containing protein [Niastella caeni]
MKKWQVLALLGIIIISSCGFGGRRIRGNGNVRTEDRGQNNFKGIVSSGSFDVYVSSGSYSVKIEAEENLLPYIQSYVEGDVLKLRTKNGYWLSPEKDIKIYVSAPALNKIISNGSGNIVTQSKISDASRIEIEVNGSADIKADVDAPEVKAELRGSGDMSLTGDTKSFTGKVVGSGDIRAMDLKAEETTIEIVGSGNADVYSSVKLNVNVAGSGDVRYKGGGEVNSHIAGSGGVKKLD